MSGWITPGQAALAMEEGDGSGVRIALLDSGVEIGHPDFTGRTLRDDCLVAMENAGGAPEAAREPEGASFPPGKGEDLYGHGTGLAGIIWQLAPKAEIGSFRVLGPNLGARTAQVSLAASRAIELGYHLLNCSFGCPIGGHLALYKAWVDHAERRGVHIVAASSSHDPGQPEWPAHFSSVLGVDCGPSCSRTLVRTAGRMVEFAAPGAEKRVPWRNGSHRVMTGSSFAAAHLCGLLARLLSVHPLKDPLQLKALLRRVAGTL